MQLSQGLALSLLPSLSLSFFRSLPRSLSQPPSPAVLRSVSLYLPLSLSLSLTVISCLLFPTSLHFSFFHLLFLFISLPLCIPLSLYFLPFFMFLALSFCLPPTTHSLSLSFSKSRLSMFVSHLCPPFSLFLKHHLLFPFSLRLTSLSLVLSSCPLHLGLFTYSLASSLAQSLSA